jgi:hypothetical protein
MALLEDSGVFRLTQLLTGNYWNTKGTDCINGCRCGWQTRVINQITGLAENKSIVHYRAIYGEASQLSVGHTPHVVAKLERHPSYRPSSYTACQDPIQIISADPGKQQVNTSVLF